MALFVLLARDSEAAASARREALNAHFAHIEQVLDRLRVAGPLRDARGSIVGSLFVVEAEDEADARAWLAADPYHAAGVWATVEVWPFNAAAGQWVGGTTW